MICPECGHALDNTGGALYCAYCGAKLNGNNKKRRVGRALAAGAIASLLLLLMLAAIGAVMAKFYAYSEENILAREATALSLYVKDHDGFFYPGDTVKLSMDLFPPQAAPASVEWRSSDESVVTVDETGNVSLIKDGEAVITAILDNGVEARYALSVVKRPYRINLNEKKVKLEVGESFVFLPTVIPSDAVYGGIVWESSDSSVVSVDEDGAVKGLKQGRATVTATVAGSVAATAEVFVYKYKFDLLAAHIYENGAFDREYEEYYITLSFTETREHNGELMNKHYYISYFPDSDQIVLYSDLYNDEGSVCCELLVYFERSNRSSARVQFYFASDRYDGSILETMPMTSISKGLEINAWGRIDLASYDLNSGLDFERYEGEEAFREDALQIADSLLKNGMSMLSEQWESFELGADMGEVLGLEAMCGS